MSLLELFQAKNLYSFTSDIDHIVYEWLSWLMHCIFSINVEFLPVSEIFLEEILLTFCERHHTAKPN